MQTLQEIHIGKSGKVSDKWSSYLATYERAFSPLRDKEIALLEIGVQNGGSLEVWANYFANGQLFVGCDINPKCVNLDYCDDRIKVVVGDANSQEAFNAITHQEQTFDLIIDDGSHLSRDIFATFINYFPVLKPGGIFVVEDAHTLFMNSYGGGILNHLSAQKFFYKLADLVSFEFWSAELPLSTFFTDFFPSGQVPPFLLEGWVDAIQFRNSMIIIEKAVNPTHNKLGLRSIVGHEAIVEPTVLSIKPDSRFF